MKKVMKAVCAAALAALGLAAVFWMSIVYVTEYKKEVRDISVSPDGKYELELVAVGEPDWPFGSAKGKLILKAGEKKIGQTDFELRNDGGMITERCWKVTWYEEYVEVVLSGAEQPEQTVTLYFR